jgi:SAM-dependent methyltransferase
MPLQYQYQPEPSALSFDAATRMLAERGHDVVSGAIDNASPGKVEKIVELAGAAGLRFDPLQIDIGAYRAYVESAGYGRRYASYYRGNQPEKSLEHWITYTLLGLRPTEVFIDIASEHSPVPEIFWRLAGVCSFAQDISYPAGVNGSVIGGDACAMPVAAAFAHKAALTCSLEHFEQDGDIRLFAELARVLRPGGSVCVVPFYLYTVHATQTDPLLSVNNDVIFDDDAVIHCAKGWGNRHGRFYSPMSFKHRIVDRFRDRLSFGFYRIVNAADVDKSIYARFAMVATRTS